MDGTTPPISAVPSSRTISTSVPKDNALEFRSEDGGSPFASDEQTHRQGTVPYNGEGEHTGKKQKGLIACR